MPHAARAARPKGEIIRMKKLLAVLLGLIMLTASCALAQETEIPPAEIVDTAGSASVADFYGAYAIAGDALMEAINSYAGFYAVATVNEDGTPNLAFFVYGCVKVEDKYYISLGIAENQTRENILRTGEAVAMYGAVPAADSGMPYAVAGARMTLKLVTDEALLSQLANPQYPGTLFAEIVSLRSLG